MSEKEQGKVKWIDSQKGFGFIERTQGPDVFVHHNTLAGEGYTTLVEGQQVEFTVVQG